MRTPIAPNFTERIRRPSMAGGDQARVRSPGPPYHGSYNALMRHWGALVGASLVACTGSPTPTELPQGRWGGEHVSLTVTAAGADLEFDCAHGRVEESLRLDARGQFSLRGVYVREHGGPVREGEPEDRRPALYLGQLEGSRLGLS